ncbi:dipeptide epimerase [Sulfurimonas sp.]
MHITDIQTSIQNIPLKTPFITALRRVENVSFIRVKIFYDNGSYSYGEAPATKAITGETLQSIESSIKELSPKLIGLGLQDALELIHVQTIGSSAKAALDIALCDVLYNFNVQDTEPIQTDITISLNTTEIMLEDAKEALCDGMDILKIKLGSDIEHAIYTTQLLAKNLSGAKLLIDANQAWSFNEALYYIENTRELRLQLIEQPVVAKDLDSLKKLRKISHTPILADEAVFTLEDVKLVMEGGYADMINIKLMKCGGVSKAIEILEYARENKIICMFGSMLEGPYSINAAVQLALMYRDVVRYIDLDSPLLYKNANKHFACTINKSTYRLKSRT